MYFPFYVYKVNSPGRVQYHPSLKSYIISDDFFFIEYFIVVLLQLSQFFPHCSPLPHPHTVNSHPVVHVHGSFIHVP